MTSRVGTWSMDDATEIRIRIEGLYDAIGDLEWLRLERDGAERVAFEIHRRYLRRHVQSHSQVLEIGAGPGRFTIVLAGLGCEVVVSDLSRGQLELNERHVQDAGCDDAVIERLRLDVLRSLCVGGRCV